MSLIRLMLVDDHDVVRTGNAGVYIVEVKGGKYVTVK